jgi:pimeloyl-ACP methyl ester carboxylesterase
VGHVAWYLTGTRPDVLLLHGFSDSAQCWEMVLPTFTRYGGVLRTDARGHGRSGLPAGPVGALPQADEQAAVLRELADRPVAVVGHSMGGLTGVALAARYPELVSTLVLEDPALFPMASQRPGAPPWLAELSGLDHDARLRWARATENWAEDELDSWSTSKDQFTMEYCERPVLPVDPLAELWPRVRCPVLLLLADAARDTLVSAQLLERAVATATAPLTVVRLAGTGHSVRRDDRAGFLAAVTAHLDATVI